MDKDASLKNGVARKRAVNTVAQLIRQFRNTGTKIATISVENRASSLLRLILAVSVLAFTASPVFAQVTVGNTTVGSSLDSGDSHYLNGSRV